MAQAHNKRKAIFLLTIMLFMMVHNVLPHTHHQHVVTVQDEHLPTHHHHHSSNADHHHHSSALSAQDQENQYSLLDLLLSTHVHISHAEVNSVLTSENISLAKQTLSFTKCFGEQELFTGTTDTHWEKASNENVPRDHFLNNSTSRGPPTNLFV
ncbi:hypothetical protein BKI52_06265 [marine bacterium AO1-C]|nr:hypothetical protein BKI52_06265 [marine bacterium AO1-C]